MEIIHWGQLPDGRVVVQSHSSSAFDDLLSKDELGLMRATMHFNFLVLEPREDTGCSLINFLKVELGGQVPTSLVNTALRKCPQGMATVKKTLARKGPFNNIVTLAGYQYI